MSARLHTREFLDVVADLREQLVRWPVRERCWELLILALYRGGDPSAALVAYQQARAALSGQLGIEPGPRLQGLQRAVLNRDPGLDGAPPHESVVLTSVPASRSDPAPELIGRETELAALVAALDAGPGLVVVSGPGGVGTSALAARAAEAAAGRFPDGRVTVDLAGGLGALVRALGRPVESVPRTVDELLAVYRSMVSGQRMLIVLDNAADPGLVRMLRSEGLSLLVVSRRRRLLVGAAEQVEVGPLAGQDAVELLTRYAGAGRAGDDRDAAREVARVCDGLPLALRAAGEWLAAQPDLPVRTFATRLTRRPLDGLGAEHPSMRDTFAADLRAVATDYPLATRVFPLFGRMPVATPEQLAQPLDADPDQVFFTLRQLVDRWLVDAPEPERYRAVGLARAYAAELAEASAGSGRHRRGGW